MPRLVSLTLNGSLHPSTASVRRFTASGAFPRLAHLRLAQAKLSAAHIALLARGTWPLRHLALASNEVRKAGCEALAAAPFARTLRVLELPDSEVTSSGVQTLAGPLAGAALFTWLEDVVSRNVDYWRAAIGAVILLLVLTRWRFSR